MSPESSVWWIYNGTLWKLSMIEYFGDSSDCCLDIILLWLLREENLNRKETAWNRYNWSILKVVLQHKTLRSSDTWNFATSRVADMRMNFKLCRFWQISLIKAIRMSVLMVRSWASSRMMISYLTINSRLGKYLDNWGSYNASRNSIPSVKYLQDGQSRFCILQQCLFAGHILETDRITDLCANLDIQLLADSFGNIGRCNTTRLGASNPWSAISVLQ